MSKNATEIVSKIMKLVTELGDLAGVKTDSVAIQTSKKTKVNQNDYTGTIGGITMLIDDGFLNSPKTLVEIINKLKEEGRYDSKSAISMTLLNLVKKKRTLSRLGKKGAWQYVVRK